MIGLLKVALRLN